MKKELKEKIIIITFAIVIMLTLLGITYAFFQSSGEVEQEKVTITSGILSLTFKDNDDTVENIKGTWNFGDTIEKELVIENTGTKDTYAKISWDDLINTYLAESLTYTLEEKTDEDGSAYQSVETEGNNVPRSETASTVMLADHLEIPARHTYTYRLRITLEDLPDIDQTADINANFVTKFTIAESTKKWTAEDSLAKLNIKINPNNTVNFANPAITDETENGLFSMADDYGTSYYYRGTAPNNYIKFGQNASGQDMWWRIIRFNGDGSIRIQYDGAGAKGTNTYTRGFALTSQPWNSKSNDAKYVGWMFGGNQGVTSTSKEQAQTNETNSEIKIAVDNWYKTNIVDTGYSNYIADTIFCNDRSTPGKSETNWSYDTGLGYAKKYTAYGAYARSGVSTSRVLPQFTCPQENDKFTVKTSSGGNGASTYPVGLITADEIVAGGGVYNTANQSYYLNKGEHYWVFSPYYLKNDGYACLFDVYNNGILDYIFANSSVSVAPVINLKAEYLSRLEGRGTLESPYYLEIN